MRKSDDIQNSLRPGKAVIDYVMAAIIEFGRRHGLTIREASNYLNRFKGLDFLEEFYDVEHTFRSTIVSTTLLLYAEITEERCNDIVPRLKHPYRRDRFCEMSAI